jgi:hypothetical protein
MIHIATVHHLKPDWIEIQRRYLDRFIAQPFRTYASLEGISEEYNRFFDVVVPSKGAHAGKLNLLGRVIADTADSDDLIMFVDGDSFPVADPMAPIEQLLADSSLAAVCRLENDGDLQPHPCFCVVPVRTWLELRGDWSSGHLYAPDRTDVGANLLHILETTGTRWAKILRTSTHELHPVLFGIYGGFWYHHGAGFRKLKLTKAHAPEAGGRGLNERLRAKRFAEALGAEGLEREVERVFQNAELSERIMAKIRSDPDFFVELA